MRDRTARRSLTLYTPSVHRVNLPDGIPILLFISKVDWDCTELPMNFYTSFSASGGEGLADRVAGADSMGLEKTKGTGLLPSRPVPK